MELLQSARLGVLHAHPSPIVHPASAISSRRLDIALIVIPHVSRARAQYLMSVFLALPAFISEKGGVSSAHTTNVSNVLLLISVIVV
jgi:hypothetical protein